MVCVSVANNTYSDQQKTFAKSLVWDELSPKEAATKAGYSHSSVQWLTDNLRDLIIEETEKYLATYGPQAGRTLVDSTTVEGSVLPGVEKRINAATQILDRIGLTKKDRPQQIQQGQIGIVFLPPKENA